MRFLKFFRYIRRQLRRSTVSNVLFCLLLAFAGTLLCISAGLWYSAHRAILDIDDTITTIGVPDSFMVSRYADENNISEDEAHELLRERVYSSELLQFDTRRLYNAHAEGITTVPLRTQGFGIEPHIASLSPMSTAAFFVTCERVEAEYRLRWQWDDIDSDDAADIPDEERTYTVFVERTYRATFTVEEVLHLHRSYERPGRRIAISFILDYGGVAPFEGGQQYIVTGSYRPGGFGAGMSALIMDTPQRELTEVSVGYVYDSNELLRLLGWASWGVDYLPLEIREPLVIQRDESAEPSFFEVTGSLEDALDTEIWARMIEELDIAAVSAESFPVLTTGDANSLFRVNQRRNLFTEGRIFTAGEIRNGERVALVTRHFAEHNELSVGDVLPLRLYAAVLGYVPTWFSPGGYRGSILANIWIPSLYHPDLEVTEPIGFTIVGIMDTFLWDIDDHAIPRNMVIIPDSSFEGVSGEPVSDFNVREHVPLLADGLIIPNGFIQETRATINSIEYGYAVLFRFFDQGYGTLMVALSNLRFGMSWILGLVLAVWIAVVFLFSMFYTARKRKEAAVLCAIGVSKKNRFGWVFAQSALLIILSLGISLAVTIPIFGYIVDAAANITEAFTLEFRDLRLSDAADAGLRNSIPLSRSTAALTISAVGGAALLLVVTALMSERVVVFKTLSAGKGEG
ncbi:MAG: hypothetical protein FWC20_04885 [Oscillospiraceae bacterium]|nr:hypothetical protein [Oscillospiraceae bacterium]MCL2278729.1 hypothetical protein [Oscillospiraceae bacterium]